MLESQVAEALDTWLESRMYALLFVVISAVIFYLLLGLNWILALVFFMLAAVGLPAMVIHRRDADFEMEMGPDTESHSRGVMRLVSIVGLDTTGIALGVLLLILIALLARKMAYGF